MTDKGEATQDTGGPVLACDICGTGIYGSYRGHGDGSGHRFAHEECYWREQAEQARAERDRFETLWNESQDLLERLRGFPGPQQQRCRYCGRADGIDWGVSNDVWEQVRAEGAPCLPCFDRLAVAAGVTAYQLTHLYYVSDIGLSPDFDAVDKDRHEWIGRYHESQDLLAIAREENERLSKLTREETLRRGALVVEKDIPIPPGAKQLGGTD